MRIAKLVLLVLVASSFDASGQQAEGLKEWAGPEGSTLIYVPARKVGTREGVREIGPFWIGRDEVTWSQYRRFCAETRRPVPEAQMFSGLWELSPGHSGRPAGDQATKHWEAADDVPVTNVSWLDARAYCRWAGLRLPTTAEWHALAQTSPAHPYPWGDQDDLTTRANLQGADDGHDGPSPVGSFPAGAAPNGVQGLLGNVSEWIDGEAPGIQMAGLIAARLHGASWATGATGWLRDNVKPAEFQNGDLGFRVCLGRRPRVPGQEPVAAAPTRPRPRATPRVARRPQPTAVEVPADLLADLEASYARLLEQTPAVLRSRVEEAASKLEGAGGQWGYRDGLLTIRSLRPRAAVPLLLRHTLRKPEDDRSKRFVGPEAAKALEFLTGTRSRDVAARVEFARWWLEHESELAVTPADMTQEQIEVLVGVLLDTIREQNRRDHYGDRGVTANGVARKLAGSSSSSSRDQRQPWSDADLDARMTPVLLEAAATLPDTRWETVPLLAGLRRRGEARELEARMRDPKASTAIRLVAALSLKRAGETPSLAGLIPLLQQERDLELRLALVLTLGDSKEQAALDAVLASLDAPHPEVRAAAVNAVSKQKNMQAIPRLQLFLADPDDPSTASALAVLGQLARGGNDQIAAVIVDFMARLIDERPSHRMIYSALSAFRDASGERGFIEAGAHDPRYYRGQAIAAVRWWREIRGKSADEQTKVLLDMVAENPTHWVIERLSKVRTTQATGALADLLKRLVGKSGEHENELRRKTLAAFMTATGQRFGADRRSGFRDQAELQQYYADAVQEALSWWGQQQH